MAIDQNAVDTLFGTEVRTSDDQRLGDVGQVYVDDETGRPEWVTVRTGLFGTKETFVPVRDADVNGGVLRVPFEKKLITDAPRVDADQGHLSPEEEDELYRYYGTGNRGAGQQDTTGTTGDRTGGQDAAGTVGHDTSGPTTDEAMTRSEERLRVGTQDVETGRVRLRKHIVTEQQSVQVPVSHEEVVLEREPITDENRGAAEAGPELSEEEHEVVLHAETPVVEKEVVPVERVRVGKETVEETTTVSDQVRKEEVEVDRDDVDDTRRGR